MGKGALSSQIGGPLLSSTDPTHEMMAEQRKEGKEATTLVGRRDGSYPCALPPRTAFI